MIIKVGNKIYSSKEFPIMVCLEDYDKENIKNMPDSAHKYCEYVTPGDYPENAEYQMTEEEIRKWMREDIPERFNPKE